MSSPATTGIAPFAKMLLSARASSVRDRPVTDTEGGASKLGALAAKLIESSWCAAVVVVPIFFNGYSSRVFEEDKIPLLRSLAVAVAALLIVWGVEAGRAASQSTRRLWNTPLVKPALALTAAYVLSTVFSIAPRISWAGAYLRCQGTYTWLSYVLIFAAIVLLARSRQQIDRVVTLMILTTLPLAGYAIIQRAGCDPIHWAALVSRRVQSTAGNPIFLAAFMLMVVPLTLARLIGTIRSARSVATGGGMLRAAYVLSGGYAVLLGLQLLTIVYTESRGPVVGLAVALVFFFTLVGLERRTRWLVVSIPVLAAAALVVLWFVGRSSRVQMPSDKQSVERLSQIFALEQGSGRVRTLIWGGATALVAANPDRLLTGYGPETLFLAYWPFYPPALAHFESAGAAPDRSHNEIFDSLIMTGVIGCVAELIVFASLFHWVLCWLGLIRTRGQRQAFVAAVTAGSFLGAITPYLVDGSFRFAGVGIPAGLVAGVMTYLLVRAFGSPDSSAAPLSRDRLLLVALFAGAIGHFIEIQVGIAVAATRLYFWVFAALAVVAGTSGALGLGAEAASDTRTANREDGMERTPGDPLFGSLMVGLMLIILTFDFYTPDVVASPHRWWVPALLFGAWSLSGLVLVTESLGSTQAVEPRWAPFKTYVAGSLGFWIPFVAVYLPWIHWPPHAAPTADGALIVALHEANNLFLLYLFVFLSVVSAAAIAARGHVRRLTTWTNRPVWGSLGYALLLLGIIPVIARTNLNVSRADVLARQAKDHEEHDQLDRAVVLERAALRLQPRQDYYATDVGRLFMVLATRLPLEAHEQCKFDLEHALTAMKRALRLNPLNPDNPRNLARVHWLWATLTPDPVEQTRHFDEAEKGYEQTARLNPNSATLRAEWAQLALEHNDSTAALKILAESLRLDDLSPQAHLLRAGIYVDQQQYDQALTDYNRALAIDSRSLAALRRGAHELNRSDKVTQVSRRLLAALRGKALVLPRLNRFDEAIQVNQRILTMVPRDMSAHRDLALLYRETGQLDLAKTEAKAALAVAAPRARPALQKFLNELEAQQATK
jgi:regulator of sirC expression with transglutaminase-like and TPR domain